MSKEEEFQWGVAAVVFVIVFVLSVIYYFFSNCIFEWPPRWDIGTCFSEQIQPAKEKAAEKAANFIP